MKYKYNGQWLTIPTGGGSGASTWDEVADKPFESIGTGLIVNDDDELVVESEIDDSQSSVSSTYSSDKIDDLLDDKQDTIPTYTMAEYEAIEDDIPIGALFNIKDDKTQVTNAGTNKYSTDEIICGEWIDGKPIYRKVICFNSVNPNPNTFTLNTNINNIDQGIKICGYAEKNGTIPVQFIQTGFYSIEGNLIYCFCVRLSQNGSAQVQLTWGNHTTDTSFNIKLIAEYTKTTD